jgi:hypothetical protein
MFLQILGILFLIILCILAYYAWRAFRFLKTQANSDISVAMSVLPALGLDLATSSREEWKEQSQLDYLESQLKRIGAIITGYFCFYHGNAEILVSMWNIKNQAVAFMYEGHSNLKGDAAALFFEVACKLKSGSLCITSNPHAIYDSRPEKHRIIYNEANSIIDFIKALRTNIPQGEKLVRIKDPMLFSKESYEDIAEWAWRADQLNSDKTRQVLSSVGIKVTDELMQQLIDMGTSYSIEVSINRAKRKLTKHSKIDIDKWEKIRDELVYVTDKMDTDNLIDAIYELAGTLSDTQTQVLDGFEANTNELTDPLGAFQMLLSSLNLKVKRVATMDTPTRTEIYLPLHISI